MSKADEDVVSLCDDRALVQSRSFESIGPGRKPVGRDIGVEKRI